GRHSGRGDRGAGRRGRLEERGAPARAVAPVYSLLDLRRRCRHRRTQASRAAPRRDERHLAGVPGPHGGRAPGGGRGDARRPAGGRGGAGAARRSGQARAARRAPHGAGDTGGPRPGVPGRLPRPRRHPAGRPPAPEGGGGGRALHRARRRGGAGDHGLRARPGVPGWEGFGGSGPGLGVCPEHRRLPPPGGGGGARRARRRARGEDLL
ncbi:MAG: Putative Nudix hydrolase YfcD, partial [uncultured Rubrobacteraceae bacterium]